MATAFASGFTNGELNAAAETPLTYSAFSNDRNAGIIERNGVITLLAAGEYLITATLYVPESTPLNTILKLTKDGNEIPGGVIRICSVNGGTSHTVQVLVTSFGGTRISVVPESSFTHRASSPNQSLLVTNVVRIA